MVSHLRTSLEHQCVECCYRTACVCWFHFVLITLIKFAISAYTSNLQKVKPSSRSLFPSVHISFDIFEFAYTINNIHIFQPSPWDFIILYRCYELGISTCFCIQCRLPSLPFRPTPTRPNLLFYQ